MDVNNYKIIDGETANIVANDFVNFVELLSDGVFDFL